MRIHQRFTVVVVAAALVACVQEPPEYLEPLEEPPATAPPPIASAREGSLLPDDAIRIDPLPTCDIGQTTTIHWSDAAVASGPISFWIEGDPPSLFAQTASAGSKETGAWASPGLRISVTNQAGGVLRVMEIKAEVDCD